MRDRLLVGAYLVAVLVLTSVHDPRLLAGAPVLIALLAGRDALRLARRAALAILLFNSAVTLSYAVIATLQERFSWDYVALVNLRVFSLTFLTFLVVARVNAYRAFAFSKSLLFLLTLATSQALTLRRQLAEFRLALRSRTLGRLGLRDLYRHRAATAGFFLRKSLHDAREIEAAMKARGFGLD